LFVTVAVSNEAKDVQFSRRKIVVAQMLGEAGGYEGFLAGVRPLDQVVGPDGLPGEIKLKLARIGEPIQTDEQLMARFHRGDVLPGRVVTVSQNSLGVVILAAGGDPVEIDLETAAHVFVRNA